MTQDPLFDEEYLTIEQLNNDRDRDVDTFRLEYQYLQNLKSTEITPQNEHNPNVVGHSQDFWKEMFSDPHHIQSSNYLPPPPY